MCVCVCLPSLSLQGKHRLLRSECTALTSSQLSLFELLIGKNQKPCVGLKKAKVLQRLSGSSGT